MAAPFTQDSMNPVVRRVQTSDSHGTDALEACRRGDGDAWQAFFTAHYDFVYRSARRLGIPAAEIDDVCQEVFLVVFRKLDRFEEGRITTWMYRIAANVVSDRHRRRRYRDALAEILGRETDDEPGASAGERRLEQRDAERLVGTVLAAMKPRRREVLALYELEGLSGQEVAERLGIRVDTVWVHLHNARKDFIRIAEKKGLRGQWLGEVSAAFGEGQP